MEKLLVYEIQTILDAYSIRPREFIKVEGQKELVYRSHILHSHYDYYIRIEPQKDGTIILVYHSDSTGKRTFVDLWDKSDSALTWRFRNPNNMPFTDRAVIADMEREITELKEKGRVLENELREINH